MSSTRSTRTVARLRRAFAIVALVALTPLGAASAQNHAPNPYQADPNWAEAPPGRPWGSTSAVYPARDGSGNIWVGERCGANLCTDKPDLDPIVLYSPAGKVLKSFGKGLILWPHGIHVDKDNNVWLTDARGGEGKGHQIHKFSPDGKLLMSLGVAGVAGLGKTIFNQPSDVYVAPDGSIFVADGHGAGDNNRIVKFGPDGKYVKEWGQTGAEAGEFRDPHALAMDSQGRLFVGDRGNSRIQIFDQEGQHLSTWYQFGRPSGIFIDPNDVIYVADSESNARRNPGFKRGIRIGSARDGFVTAFIPDPEPNQDASATSAAEGVAADAAGNVYGAEVGPRRLVRYTKK
jgi:sugar lactone lactonase YvrE